MMEAEYVAGNPQWNGSDKLVVISGCSGGGKSSLLQAMAARGYPVCPEPGRQIVKEQQSIGGDALPWINGRKFAELCISRALYFYNMARPVDKPALFDRSFIDNIAGLQRAGVPLPPAYHEIIRTYRYAKRVFLVPPWPELFTTDAERQHGFDAAVAEYESLVNVYQDWGYAVMVIPRGTVAERADFWERALGYKENNLRHEGDA
ncbi:MAG: AAA family ATPase [Caldilineaceae bacterium]